MIGWRRLRRLKTQLAEYLEGELPASERPSFEAALGSSADLRRRLAQLELIRAALAAPDPELDRIDLSARVQAALRRPPEPRRAGWLPRMAWGALAGAGLLLAAFAWREPEFRAKSLVASSAERWAGVQAYRVNVAGQPERLGSELHTDDGLAFAYTNLGPEPFQYLMIVARSDSGHVYWYHPAYEREGTDPESVGIAPGVARLALGEVIRHDLTPGPLVVHALFSRRPLRVTAVEAWLAGGSSAASLPEVHVQHILTTVARP